MSSQTSSRQSSDDEDYGLHATLGERVFTAVAVALALMVVTSIAVLIGNA